MAIQLIVDGAEMQQLLRGPDGPIFNDLVKKGDLLIQLGYKQIEARRSHWGRATNAPGKLTLRKRFGQSDQGLTLSVVASSFSTPDYAYWVHEGNGPLGSRIYPTSGRTLAFVTSGARPSDAAGWKEARAEGRAIIVRSVRASTPNRFLTDNLREAIDAV